MSEKAPQECGNRSDRLDLKMNKFSTGDSVNIWIWAGRVLPMTALLLTGIFYAFDIKTAIDYLMVGVAGTFGTIAFTWWWWVVYAIKHVLWAINDSKERFDHLIIELRETKTLLRENKRRIESMHEHVDDDENPLNW